MVVTLFSFKFCFKCLVAGGLVHAGDQSRQVGNGQNAMKHSMFINQASIVEHKNIANREEDLLKTPVWDTFGKIFAQKLISGGSY